MKRKLQLSRWFCMALFAVLITASSHAQIRTASVTGNWDNTATWGGASVPTSVNDVVINIGITVTVNVAASCNSVTFGSTSGTITVNSGMSLNVVTGITLQNSNTANRGATLAGSGSINCTSIQIGGNSTAPTADRTTTLTSSVSSINVSGDLNIRSEDNGANQGNASFVLQTGSLSVAGTIVLDADSDGGSEPTSDLDLNGGGGETGTLILPGATPFSTPGAGNVSTDFNGSNATVIYSGADQSIRAATYRNLSISGSGTKTLSGSTTVNLDLNLTSGTLAAGTNLNIGGGGTPAIRVSGGSMTGNPQTGNDYDVFYTGSSKTTGTELAGTGLSDININLTTNETLTLDANRSPDGNVTITEGIFDLQAFTINRSSGGGTFEIQNGGWLKIGGTNSFPSNYSNHNVSNGDATIEYSGTAQSITNLTGEEYTILILSGSGAKTFSGTRTVRDKLSIQGSATVTGAGVVSYTPANNTTLEYANTSSLTSSNIEFPTANGPDNLQINGAGGVTLHAVRTITGALTLLNGILTTSGTEYLNLDNNATASSGSNASYVNGPLRKTGDDVFTFPVGKSGLYSPLTITAPNATGDVFQAEYMRASGALLGGISASGLYRVSNCEYWILDEVTDAGAANTIDITVGWFVNSGCGGKGYVTDLSGITLAHFDNGTTKWDSYAGTASGNPTTGTVTRTGVTTFSPFTLGSTVDDGNPLPVKFSGIKAYEKQTGIQLDWKAYQEMDVDMYQVERSADGVSFVSIGTVDAKNLSVETRYTFFDASPLPGNNFYRLRNIDFDGKAGYSNIVKLSLDKSVKDITIYPNPVRGEYISLQSSDLAKGNYAVRLLNSSGQQVYMQRFSHIGGAINETIQLPAGMQSGIYFLQLDKEGRKVLAKPIVVQQ